MDLGLRNRAAVVLAASRGLGRATAHALAAEGARVLIASRSREAVEAASRAIAQATGAPVIGQPCDVTRPGDLEALAERARRDLGGIDVLVTNAGGPPAGGFGEFDDAAWQRAFDLNLMSAVRMIRLALPSMRARGGGRIVNLASTSARQPIEGLLLSNVMRAGVAALTRTLANELGPEGILVNTVGPGRIATERLVELDTLAAERRGVTPEEVRRSWEARIPLGRYGTPEEFARAVVWLASWANTYVTGQMLLVDGGMVKCL